MRYRGGDYSGTGYQGTDYQRTRYPATGYQGTNYQGTDYQGTDYQRTRYPATGYQGTDYQGTDYQGTDYQQEVNEAQQLLNNVRQTLQRTSNYNNLINDIEQIIPQLTVSNIGKVRNYITQLEQFKYSSQYNGSQLSEIQTIINNIKENLNSNTGILGSWLS
jgi:hypothetical protein